MGHSFRALMAVCLFLVVAGPVSDMVAQKHRSVAVSPCALAIDESPIVRGLQLRQPLEDLRATIPKEYEPLERSTDEYGVMKSQVSAEVAPERFADLQYISLTYFDRRLVDVEFRYKNSVQWKSNLHFVAAITEQLKLPRAGWLNGDPSYLSCQGFTVEVAMQIAPGAEPVPRLRLVDQGFAEALRKRKEEVEARKRAKFKP